ncbi:hypothetical protein OG352_13790 [Streptomyces sp. NBC_01485]|uniref:hypothetical protein n=1 Tax=Streptomyces sp. NBC_01485 TaxID=2903884 RepID=UPI002E2FE940|nr:hypothetical protein [Streptomyces sp. NBC_01485]
MASDGEEGEFRLGIPPAEWVFAKNPDVKVQRTSSPTILENAKSAADWIRKEKPLLWTGSIFSVPDPSGFPSGAAVTESILDLLIPSSFTGDVRQQLIETIQPRWPLESLLDLFELAGFDLSASLLSFFNDVNGEARPNDLHRAVARYYHDGFASSPLCFTVNWDTLQERAFGELGYEALVASPSQRVKGNGESFTQADAITVFHPHGSFQTRDVVCSYTREVIQLPVAPHWLDHPVAFLGYSGYEPSLYDHLHGGNAQLWCVKDLEYDMQIPAKRRLLCRPGVFVYEGDLRELLAALGLLDTEVALKSNYLQLKSKVPEKLVDLLATVLVSSVDPNVCLNALSSSLLSFSSGMEGTIRYCMIMRCLMGHIRNRVSHPGIFPALMMASYFRDSEQVWISALAYLLRTQKLPSAVISGLLDRSREAAKKCSEGTNPIDAAMTSPGTILGRSRIYQNFVAGSSAPIDPNEYFMPPFYGGDLAGVGEFTEVLAFEYLRRGRIEQARNVFDYSATRFYLSGNWNAGKVNEWASSNIDLLNLHWDKNTLVVPH